MKSDREASLPTHYYTLRLAAACRRDQRQRCPCSETHIRNPAAIADPVRRSRFPHWRPSGRAQTDFRRLFQTVLEDEDRSNPFRARR